MNTVVQCLATVHGSVVVLAISKHSLWFSMYYTVLGDNACIIDTENYSESKKLLLHFILCNSACLFKNFVDGVLNNYRVSKVLPF